MNMLAKVTVPFLLLLGGQLHSQVSTVSAKVDQEQLRKLIAGLGSANFAEREHAAQELMAAGTLALEPLRAALKNPDAEISGRAARLVAFLEKQALSTRMLAGKKVRLNVKDVSVVEAISELARQSEYRLEATGNLTLLRERKITLDSGEVTFWEALQQLCDKGKLTETANVHYDQPPYSYRKGGNPYMAANLPRSSVLLIDGQAKQMPVCLRGSLRIRALSLDSARPGEAQVLLDVRAESRLQEFGIIGLAYLGKIVDDHGQTLSPVEPESAPEFMNTARFGGVGNGSVSVGSGPGNSVALRIKLGEKQAKTLREISGKLCVQALDDPEILVKVDGVLQAAGRSYVGKDGFTIHMRDVEKMEDGSYLIRLSVESPAMQQQDPFATRNIRGRGKWKALNIELPEGAHVNPPRLVDAAGKEFVPEVASQSVGFNTSRQVVQNFGLIFRPADPALKNPWPAPPAQLVLHGQRIVQFSVPFTLKNIPVR